MEHEKFYVKPYHLQVPAFGDWGFNLASKKSVDKKVALGVKTKFLSNEKIDSLFIFAKDELPRKNIEINSLSKPVFINYYSKAIKKLGISYKVRKLLQEFGCRNFLFF